jgi:glycerol-3-phosphate dehydrogenase
MALAALRAVQSRLPRQPRFDTGQRMLDLIEPSLIADLDPGVALRLFGRYGVDTLEMLQAAPSAELEPIETLPTLWAELRWAAREEGVVHLDDLLLRRVRLGLLLPQGGLQHIDRIRAIVQPELGWSDERWTQEVNDYTQLWNRCYNIIH